MRHTLSRDEQTEERGKKQKEKLIYGGLYSYTILRQAMSCCHVHACANTPPQRDTSPPRLYHRRPK
jgi:hypothetical protein